MSNFTEFSIVIASAVAYLVCSGVTWELLPECEEFFRDFGDSPMRHFASGIWPVTLAYHVVWRAFMLGVRVIRRDKIPRAQVRK